MSAWKDESPRDLVEFFFFFFRVGTLNVIQKSVSQKYFKRARMVQGPSEDKLPAECRSEVVFVGPESFPPSLSLSLSLSLDTRRYFWMVRCRITGTLGGAAVHGTKKKYPERETLHRHSCYTSRLSLRPACAGFFISRATLATWPPGITPITFGLVPSLGRPRNIQDIETESDVSLSLLDCRL